MHCLSAQQNKIQLIDSPNSSFINNYESVFSDSLNKVIIYDKTHGFGSYEMLIGDAETVRILKKMPIQAFTIQNVFFGKEEQSFFINTQQSILEYDYKTGEMIHEYKGKHYGLSINLSPYVPLTPKKEQLLFFNNSRTHELWDTHTHTLIHTLEAPNQLNSNFSLNDDGRYFAGHYKGGVVRIWDLEKGEITQSIKDGSLKALRSMYYSDGQQTRTLDHFPKEFRIKKLMQKLLAGKMFEQLDIEKGFYD